MLFGALNLKAHSFCQVQSEHFLSSGLGDAWRRIANALCLWCSKCLWALALLFPSAFGMLLACFLLLCPRFTCNHVHKNAQQRCEARGESTRRRRREPSSGLQRSAEEIAAHQMAPHTVWCSLFPWIHKNSSTFNTALTLCPSG